MAGRSSEDLSLLFILHFLDDRGYNESARSLERESLIRFNMPYFVGQIRAGMFDNAEEYLYAFTNPNDNMYSARSIYLLKQLKLLEALHDGSRMYARTIVETEFPQFIGINNQIIERAAELVTMEDPRSHPMLRNFNRELSRNRVAEEVKRSITENPVFRGKLETPTFRASLQRLVSLLAVTRGPDGMVISLLPNRNGNNNGKNGRRNN